ncbi:MAG TPA: hypothetical protein VIY50_15410 [Steroidobacteraceae bacterium]
MMTRTSIEFVRSHDVPGSHCGPAAIAAAVAISLAAVSAPALAQTATAPAPAIQTGPLTLTFGGFTELATIYRNRNQSADDGSDFNTGIPFYNNANSQVSEFRESARQSRFSLLAQGEEFDGLKPEAYLETDFLSSGTTSNSRESNSYTLRMRNFYGRMQTDYGLDVVAGQSWSLVTLYKDGLNVRDENVPATIDAQYVAGFNWTRNPQLRVVEHFSKAFSLGASLESPQAVTSNGINATGLPTGTTFPPGSVNYQNSGDSAGLENNTTTYTDDVAPDVVIKAAFDPGFGHYEVYGLGREFRSSIARSSSTASGGGVGGGMILPILPKLLTFQVSALAGKGIGRYGSAQLPDVTMKPTGELAPLKEYEALIGVTLTPTDRLSIYAYAGREKESATYFTVGTATYGYGAPEFNNSGCEALTGTCLGNTKSIDDVTGGFWWKYYQGRLGNLQFGVEGEYLQRDAFNGVGGAPEANMFVGMASFRYYPYQK